MRFGESLGEACRFCGSTEIIVWPPSSAGHCAVCSEEVKAWEARCNQLAERRLAVARAAFAAAQAEKCAAERRERRAVRRAALADHLQQIARAGLALTGLGAKRLSAFYRRELRGLAASAQRARRSLLRTPARSSNY